MKEVKSSKLRRKLGSLGKQPGKAPKNRSHADRHTRPKPDRDRRTNMNTETNEHQTTTPLRKTYRIKVIDASAPLEDAQRELFCQTVFGQAGAQNVTKAYSAAYPSASRATARRAGCALMTKHDISARIDWLKREAAERTILTVQRKLEMLAARIIKAYAGFRNVLHILPDGTRTIEVNEDNASIVKKATSRIETSGRGDGAQDAAFVNVEVVDFLPYMQEHSKLAGHYPQPDKKADGEDEVRLVVTYNK